MKDGAAYARLQSTRSQTIAYALADSSVGQLAWIVEKFNAWTDSSEVPEEAVGRDRTLTNAKVYSLTSAAGSSARIYYEFARSGEQPEHAAARTPTGVAVVPHDIGLSVRSLAEKSYNTVAWSAFDRGRRFAGMDEPDLLIGDIRAFFQLVR